ncbi:hypothetical protein BD309DRAFT_973136 [Dichomitus squalens]|nr:hypothetical protein BD309DRAFT_973136 [Dichomitus squalens]
MTMMTQEAVYIVLSSYVTLSACHISPWLQPSALGSPPSPPPLQRSYTLYASRPNIRTTPTYVNASRFANLPHARSPPRRQRRDSGLPTTLPRGHMVHRPADSRLLSNLLSHEKDYSKHFSILLDHSHASLASFSAYASASAPPISQVIIAVAGSLAGADDALRSYAAAVEQWQEQLKALKNMEDDVANIMRDREILVTRLIKASKSPQKSTRDSIAPSPSGSSLSISKSQVQVGSKLSAAQAQLQACEAHLAAKEQELSAFRVHAIRSGLHARCKAMVECGWAWGEMGKEGMRALESLDMANGHGSPSMHPDFQQRLNGNDKSTSSDVSSIAPSQSASQIGFHSSPALTDSTWRAPSSPPLFPSTLPQSYTLSIPPAHSISEYAVPNGTAHPATIIEEGGGSSEEEGEDPDSVPVEVHENPLFTKGKGKGKAPASPIPSRHVSFSIRKHSETNIPAASSFRSESPTKRRGVLGSLAALFHVGSSRSSDVGAPSSASPSKADSAWRTRIDKHLASAQRGDSSDDEQLSHPYSMHASSSTKGLQPDGEMARLKKRSKRGSVQTQGSSRMALPDKGYMSDTVTESMSKAARTKPQRKRSVSKPPTIEGVRSLRPQDEAGPSSGSRLKKSPAVNNVFAAEGLGSASLSRNSSISKQSVTSTASAPARTSPAAHGRAKTDPARRRTTSLDVQPSKPGPSHKRTASASTSTGAAPSAAGSQLTNANGQPSLMSIVEGISRLNKEAALKQNPNHLLVVPKAPGRINVAYSDSLGELPVIRTTPPQPQPEARAQAQANGGSPSPRPRLKRAGQQEKPEENNYRNSLLLSASVSAPTLPLSGSTSVTAAGAINQARAEASSKPLPGSPKMPLRSALRNASRSPSPNTAVRTSPDRARPQDTTAANASPAQQTGPSTSKPAQTYPAPAPPSAERPTMNRRESDISSISSYETGREVFVGSDTEGDDSPALPPIPMLVPGSVSAPGPGPEPTPNGHADAHQQDGSELSRSTASTVQTHQAPGDAQTGAGTGAEPPRRRKSVRMSLPPTFSATPPAIEDTDEEAPQSSSHAPWSPPQRSVQRGGGGWGSKIEEAGARDLWADSDEEDAEYSAAKRLLAKVGGKR